jgi:hypothetical protein
MPLIGLDDIEWDKLRHNYGSAKNIPDLLKAVDEAKSHQEFEKLLGDLWNYIYHQGTLCEATSYTLKFAIQILKNTDIVERKVLLFMCFGETLRSRSMDSIADIRITLAIYDAVADELDYFLAYLRDRSLELQFAGLFVLSFLDEEYEKIMPALVECVQNAGDERLKASAAWVYSQLLKISLTRAYSVDFSQIIEWTESERNPFVLRLAAAFGCLSISIQISPSAIFLVAQSLKNNDWSHQQHSNRNISYLCSELMPFPDINLISGKTEIWMELLKYLNPNPTPAHLIIRELMNSSFSRILSNSWDKSSKWANHGSLSFWTEYSKIGYAPRYPTVASHLSASGLRDSQIEVLKFIVACEPFWEIPTNLFSFFYGLPDDREELRKLAEGK